MEHRMKWFVTGGTLALLITASNVASAASATSGHLITLPGHKSGSASTGPIVNGLALSLTEKPLKKEKPPYLWLSLELRNESSQMRYFLGLSTLTSYQPIVTDERGTVVPVNQHPGIDIDQGPVDSGGSPIAPGESAFLPIPISALVTFPKPGIYTVRLKTLRVVDARTGKLIELVSNPLTVHI
jgi:hypothetical protein